MILVPVGKRLVRSTNFRIDSVPAMSDRFFHHVNKKTKNRKERVEELRRYYEAQEKKLQRSMK